MRYALALLIGIALATCGANTGPPEGYLDECETDEDCIDDWTCIDLVDVGLSCSRMCESSADCPKLGSDHCDEDARFPCILSACHLSDCA